MLIPRRDKMAEEHGHKDAKFFYFVDGTKYNWDQPSITGAQIKAQVPNFDPSFALFLDAPGDDPDQLVTDQTSISLEKEKGPKRFFTVPPATFGR